LWTLLEDEDSRVVRNVQDYVEPLIIELHSKLYGIISTDHRYFILEFQKVSIKIMENFDIPDDILAAKLEG